MNIDELNDRELAENFLALLESIHFQRLVDRALKFTEVFNSENLERRERISTAKEFIEIAYQDLEASRILYSFEKYPQAMYYLQQAVEKFVKAFLIAFFGLNKKEMKKYVSHDSPKAFIRVLEKYKNLFQSILEILETFSGDNTDVLGRMNIETSKMVSIVNKSKIKIAKLTPEEMEKLIESITKIRDFFENDDTQNKITNMLTRLKRGFGELEYGTLDESSLEIINSSIEKYLKNINKILKLTSIFIVLYLLSVITYPHATFTRYPNKTLSLKNYSEDLGIVHCFEEISDLLKNTVNSFVCEITD